MKIDNSYTAALALGTSKSAPRQNTKAEGQESASEVRLSSLAESLGTTESSAPVNSDRVAELRQAIASGQFKINAGAIADRLLDTAKDLIQTQRRA